MTDIRSLAKRRGYLAVTVRDRGPIGRGLKAGFNRASKTAWERTGLHFHTTMRESRFDPEHQRKAGFALRKGQGMTPGSKAFKRSYTGRKLARFGHTRALEFTGDTRRAIRAASITSTSKGSRVAYRAASKFSFRHPKSRIRMQDEFRRILPEEATELARRYDAELDQLWQQDQG